MNNTLRAYLNIFCAVYLNDIMIFTKDIKEHPVSLWRILQQLQEASLYINREKSYFYTEQTFFLRFIIGINEIQMNRKKDTDIQVWESPANLPGLQYFLDFTNFSWMFIPRYAKKCGPMFKLLMKSFKKIEWTKNVNAAFNIVKKTH